MLGGGTAEKISGQGSEASRLLFWIHHWMIPNQGQFQEEG